MLLMWMQFLAGLVGVFALTVPASAEPDWQAVAKALGKNLPPDHVVIETARPVHDSIPNPAH